ncbi:MAG TPA: noncanonical pyrimidine nucleotidase, YjjG family, partial [Porphyromonadaceae bacterium]|nr:noncanonical pyrimidine nucleotidase, YjjG family [Porphyromonadaceae bacterium]
KEELTVERFLAPLRPFGVDDPEYAKHLSLDFLERTTRKTRLMEGAKELLDYLKPRYRMHILSNGFSEIQYKKINNSGLARYFDKIILSEEAGINKPHPDMFTYALKNTNSRR